MANPQLEDGYTQISNEILEALCWMNLSSYEWRVLLCILRKTYGWKKKTDWISGSQFSKATGLDRRHAHRAIKTLLDKKIVVICRDDKRHPRYGFQKDYERWKLALKGHVFKEKMQELRERREKKSASTDDKTVPLQAHTKKTLTKETLKKREEREEHSTRFFSLKEIQNLTKEEDQHLHEWLLREQAKFINEHGADDIDKFDWKQYVRIYYPGYPGR